jgi:hypothetical protein
MVRVTVTPERLRADIARRLRPAVRGMSQVGFDALVARIVAVELKSDARGLTPAHSPAVPPPAPQPGR